MIVGDVVSETQAWLDDASSTTLVSIKRWLNESLRDIVTLLHKHDLLEEIKYIPSRARITGDGTTGNRCNVTAASRQVLSMTLGGSSNVITAGYTGAIITLAGRSEVYRIADVSATNQCLLDRPFEGSTSTTASYDIVQDTLMLGTEVEEVMATTRTTTPLIVKWWSGREKDSWRPFPLLRGATGTPFVANVEGRHTQPIAVSTSSPDIRCSVTDGSATITLNIDAETTFNASSAGSLYGLLGQELVGAYFKLDREKRMYQVRRFTGLSASKTTFLLEEAYQLPSEYTTTTNLSWQIGHFDSIRVRLYPLPISAEQFQIRFHRRLFDVEDTNDVIPIPEKFHHVVLYGTLAKAMRWIGRLDRAQQAEAEYVRGIQSIAENVPNAARSYGVQSIEIRPRMPASPIYPGHIGFPEDTAWPY